jgi:hypothetical protein
MKKFIQYIFIPSFLMITGCETGILEQLPDNQVDMEQFYSTANDAEMGLIGVYSKVIDLSWMTGEMWTLVSADEVTAVNHGTGGIGSGDHRDLLTPSSYAMEQVYIGPYKGISNANLLIERVPEIPDEDFATGRKEAILGEAYFLRAFAYYHLAMRYRDVPIVTEFPTTAVPEDNIIAKSSQEDVLDQVLRDLEMAIDLLPDRMSEVVSGISEHDVRGRASKWAALAYKARVHLWRQEWQDALDAAELVINSQQFEMVEKWTEIWYGENNSREAIWQSQGQSRDQYEMIGVYRWYCDADPTQFGVEKSVSKDFDLGYKDVRYEYSIRPVGSDKRAVKHFHVPSGLVIAGSDESRDKNYVLVRLAELYFDKAEAIVQSGYTLGTRQEVLDILNMMRARAADADYLPRDPDVTVPEDFVGCTGIDTLIIDDVSLEAVQMEKRREMLFEGIRWYDLLRWDKEYAMEISNAASEDMLYMPLPQQEIDVCKGVLIQNPAW